MNTETIIGIIGGMVGILASVAAGIAWSVARLSRAAYKKGEHDQVHDKLSKDIGHAHRRLDCVENDVAELQGTTREHAEIHKSLIKQQDTMIKRLDDIYKILIDKG